MTDVSQTADDNNTQQTNNNGGGSGQSASGGTGGQSGQESTSDRLKSGFADLKSQAADKAYDYANQGKDKATGALDEAAKFLEDTARTIDEKVGPQYGDYARNAAESVSGLAANLRGKDIDDLIDGARDLVRKSPAIAIGAAVATGFILARIAKAGMNYEPQQGGGNRNNEGGNRSGGQGQSGGETKSSGNPTYPA